MTKKQTFHCHYLNRHARSISDILLTNTLNKTEAASARLARRCRGHGAPAVDVAARFWVAAGKSPEIGVPKKSTGHMLLTCKIMSFEGRVYVEFHKRTAITLKSSHHYNAEDPIGDEFWR